MFDPLLFLKLASLGIPINTPFVPKVLLAHLRLGVSGYLHWMLADSICILGAILYVLTLLFSQILKDHAWQASAILDIIFIFIKKSEKDNKYTYWIISLVPIVIN